VSLDKNANKYSTLYWLRQKLDPFTPAHEGAAFVAVFKIILLQKKGAISRMLHKILVFYIMQT
jgi:hypothetical protein